MSFCLIVFGMTFIQDIKKYEITYFSVDYLKEKYSSNFYVCLIWTPPIHNEWSVPQSPAIVFLGRRTNGIALDLNAYKETQLSEILTKMIKKKKWTCLYKSQIIDFYFGIVFLYLVLFLNRKLVMKLEVKKSFSSFVIKIVIFFIYVFATCLFSQYVGCGETDSIFYWLF